MYKPRVVFPFVEAGMGHIMPQRSLADAFEKKYGEYATVVRSNFFSETNKKPLIKFEQSIVEEVKKYNHSSAYGYFNMYLMDFFGPEFLSKVIMDLYIPGAGKEATAHMEELNPDMVVSTHWATNYYATKIDKKPITVMYCPDVQVIPLCRFASDLTLVSAPRGYERALKKHPKRFNEDNLKLVPFAIREEAFSIPLDKAENRRRLGLKEDQFTVVLFEGGYGLGKMNKIVELLAKTDLPVTIVAICGQNKVSYEALRKIEPSPTVTLIVEGFCENILEYIASADVFMGKSGASSVAEPCFFGVAEIITKYATTMERDNAEYYIEDVKNSVAIFDPQKAVDKIAELIAHPEMLEEMQNNALKIHENFGSEKTVDLLWEMLCKRFPELKSIKIEQKPDQNGDSSYGEVVKVVESDYTEE